MPSTSAVVSVEVPREVMIGPPTEVRTHASAVKSARAGPALLSDSA